jgi:hypothetical protein
VSDAELPDVPARVADPARVHQVFQWMLSGASEHDILDAARHEWPDVDTKPLIVAAVARLEQSGQANGTIVLGSGRCWRPETTRAPSAP